MRVRSGFAFGLLLAFLAATQFLACQTAFAQRRVALVIGNGAYRNVPMLPNPANDAGDVAASLERLGFSVDRLADASFDDFRHALIDFGNKARDAEMAVVFYAGHGMEMGGGNWLIPVDAQLRADIDTENEAIGLRSVMLAVSGARDLSLVILDACRNNPFESKMQRSNRTRAVSRGLASVEPADNLLVAFAAKDGTVAKDGAGRNSPFTAALLKHLETPGLEISFLFRNVRDDVLAATDREQQPFVYGSLSKEAVYLKPPAAGAPTVVQGPDTPPADEIAWSFLESTTDTATLHRFVRQFPLSKYLPEATALIASLEASAAQATQAPPSPQAPPGPDAQRPASQSQPPATAPKLARLFLSNTPEIESVWSLLKPTTDVAVLRRFADQFPNRQRKTVIAALGGPSDGGVRRALRGDQMRAVLSEYGNFAQHPRYGEVWVPTVTPQGWHPYEPCHWVRTRKYGWYYLDRTPWGAIVHHYGRWTHDAQMGWIWLPGVDFSPGWVVWRVSEQQIGWAPMPPVEDTQVMASDQFNNADFWIFMDVSTFDNACTSAAVAPAAQVPTLLHRSAFARELRNEAGIIYVVLPPYIAGDYVDVDVAFDPWPGWFLSQILVDWNWIWNHVDVASGCACSPSAPLVSPAAISQPPANQPLPMPQPQSGQPPQHPPPSAALPPPPPAPPSAAPPPPSLSHRPPPPPQPLPPRGCPPGTVYLEGHCVLARGPSGGPKCRPGVYHRPGTACGPVAGPPGGPCSGLSGPALYRCQRGAPGHGRSAQRPCAGLIGRDLLACRRALAGGAPPTRYPPFMVGEPDFAAPPSIYVSPGFVPRGPGAAGPFGGSPAPTFRPPQIGNPR
jgi:hypothetical protein